MCAKVLQKLTAGNNIFVVMLDTGRFSGTVNLRLFWSVNDLDLHVIPLAKLEVHVNRNNCELRICYLPFSTWNLRHLLRTFVINVPADSSPVM